MQYRRFGRTNLQMPVFSCGGMRYQFQWQDVPMSQIPDENQGNLEAIINKSLEVGKWGDHFVRVAGGEGRGVMGF